MIDGPTLWQLTEQACDGMLGLPIVPCDNARDSFDHAISAQIKITGEAEALLSLHSETSFARHLAATMYMADAGTLEEDEIHDALGELVNIIAGNIKGMVPGETLLSLPCVGQFQAAEPGTIPLENIVEVHGTYEGHGFTMRLASSAMSAIPA